MYHVSHLLQSIKTKTVFGYYYDINSMEANIKGYTQTFVRIY